MMQNGAEEQDKIYVVRMTGEDRAKILDLMDNSLMQLPAANLPEAAREYARLRKLLTDPASTMRPAADGRGIVPVERETEEEAKP